MDKKSRHILKAFSGGQSCEQILSRDRSLTYHDIFRVVTEAPTSFWTRGNGKSLGRRRAGNITVARTPASQRAD